MELRTEAWLMLTNMFTSSFSWTKTFFFLVSSECAYQCIQWSLILNLISFYYHARNLISLPSLTKSSSLLLKVSWLMDVRQIPLCWLWETTKSHPLLMFSLLWRGSFTCRWLSLRDVITFLSFSEVHPQTFHRSASTATDCSTFSFVPAFSRGPFYQLLTRQSSQILASVRQRMQHRNRKCSPSTHGTVCLFKETV